MSVTSYWTDKNGRHIESGTGKVLSTRESRAKEDIPQWKKFEIERLEDVDGVIIPGRNALQKDIDQYGKNVAKTKLKKPRHTVKKPDIEVGEIFYLNPKQLAVLVVINNYPDDRDELLGRCWISTDSTVSMRANEASESLKKSGLASGYVETVPNAKQITFLVPMSYKVQDKERCTLMFYFRKGNEGRSKIGEQHIERNIPTNKSVKPKPEAAKPKVDSAKPKPTKIMPNDAEYTMLEKALNWAGETHHGKQHRLNWYGVALSLGAEKGDIPDDYSIVPPMTYANMLANYEKFGRNARWSAARSGYEELDLADSESKSKADKRDKELERYHSDLAMQGNYTIEDWKATHVGEPVICEVEGYDQLCIFDSGAQQPCFWLDGEGEATELWVYDKETRALTFKENIRPQWIREELEADSTKEIEAKMQKALDDKDWKMVSYWSQQLRHLW